MRRMVATEQLLKLQDLCILRLPGRVGRQGFALEAMIMDLIREATQEYLRTDHTEFGPGDYYVNARHAVHQVWIEGPTVLQITGIGPWKAVPITEAPPPI